MNFIKLKCLVYCLTFKFSDIDLNGITNMFSYIVEVRAVIFIILLFLVKQFCYIKLLC